MLSEVQKPAADWVRDVAVLLGACQQLATYYGTDDEEISFKRAVAAPLRLLEAFSEFGEQDTATPSDVTPSDAARVEKLVCGERVSSLITPLLRIVVEWEPDFIFDLQPDEALRKAVRIRYGQIVGLVATHLCDPIWTKYPHLSPPNWPG